MKFCAAWWCRSFGVNQAATECASKFTLSRARMARKIAARLSMLGLPAGDNMRCRLLLGLDVSAETCSKPIVALIRSRRIRRAVSGSPLRNSVAASSNKAWANAASRPTRAKTVSLKSRVSAMGFILSICCLSFSTLRLFCATCIRPAAPWLCQCRAVARAWCHRQKARSAHRPRKNPLFHCK